MFPFGQHQFLDVRAQGIVWGYYNLFQKSRGCPTRLSADFFKAVFTFAIPMLLVTNVPVRVLVSKLTSTVPVLVLLVMSVACFLSFRMGWRSSVRHYTSASS